MEETNQTPKEQLLKSLLGRKLKIPDLQDLFHDWPQCVNPEVERARSAVNESLECQFQGRRLRKMVAIDSGRLCAMWLPFAQYEALKTMALLFSWLFAWDDETDSAEFSSLVDDPKAARRFHDDTVAYVKACLDATTAPSLEQQEHSSLITTFKPIGEVLRASYNTEQLEKFKQEMLFYLDMTLLEQEAVEAEDLPTVETYHQFRMGASAASLATTIIECNLDMKLPSGKLEEDNIRILWDETNEIISTSNDILSVKKELRQGQVVTLLPLLFHQYGDLEKSMNEAMNRLRLSKTSFDNAAQDLLDLYDTDSATQRNIQNFVLGCRCSCTANLNWSLNTGRYQLGVQSLRGGITIEL